MSLDEAHDAASAGSSDRRIATLDELAELVERTPGLCLRYSEGPENDDTEASVDVESGLDLPGLSVNPLRPESWWTRPLTDWLARQVCQYADLARKNPRRFAWVLTGREVGRGPDCEPLLADVTPVARLDTALLDEAEAMYRTRFDAGRGPED